MTLVAGVGIGTFLIAFLWISSFLVCFISLKTKSLIGPVYVISAALCMLVLYVIPKDSHSPEENIVKVSDDLFILRTSLVALLGVSSLLGGVYCLVEQGMHQFEAGPIKSY